MQLNSTKQKIEEPGFLYFRYRERAVQYKWPALCFPARKPFSNKCRSLLHLFQTWAFTFLADSPTCRKLPRKSFMILATS